jgi:hypothetical protein
MTLFPFDCRRAEELLSDHVEGTLDPLLARDLEAHLLACAECRGLRDALAEVMDVLRRPLVMEPGPGLAERIAAAAWQAGRRRAQVALARHIPVRVHAAAAALAVALSAGLFLVGASPGSTPAREVPFSVRLTEAKDALIETRDRFVEDYHILRVLVGTVFEGRLDRVGERVQDYRRLLERRQRPSPAPKKTEEGPTSLNAAPSRSVRERVHEIEPAPAAVASPAEAATKGAL